MSFRIVIPARYASTRLPGKPLADIAGKPMVVRVAEAVAGLVGAAGASGIWIASDDPRVLDAVRGHGWPAVATRADHPTGTDRIAEVAAQLGWADDDVVVNVQGDEPLIDPALVAAVADALVRDDAAAIASAAHPIHDAAEFFNPNVVKVVCNAAGHAHYFSRAPIPWARDAFAQQRDTLPDDLGALRHIGLYAYRVSFLHCYGGLPPAPTEQSESLEQLRALWHGYAIRMVQCDQAPAPGVDTPEDLARVCKIFADRV